MNFLARVAASITAFGTYLLPKLVFAGGVALTLIGVYAAVRRSGRDAERADQADAGLKAIRRANHAAQGVDHSEEAIAHDQDNLDRVR